MAEPKTITESYLEAIKYFMSEALLKEETLTKASLVEKLAKALEIDVSKFKEMLDGKAEIAETSLPKIAETLGTTTEEMEKRIKASLATEEKKPEPPQTAETKAPPVKQGLDEVFGTDSVLKEKLIELKKTVEKTSNTETQQWMSEVVRKIVEIIPLAAGTDAKSIIESLKKEVDSIKEEHKTLKTKVAEIEITSKTSKGITESLKKVIEKQNSKNGGKGLHEQSGGDPTGEAATVSESFEEMPLSMFVRK